MRSKTVLSQHFRENVTFIPDGTCCFTCELQKLAAIVKTIETSVLSLSFVRLPST